eukprot:m.107200 g.107200  ORF g.107200 m.107200 type:complete len:246 (-) comp9209_c0_seq4:982-1719(-)
MLRTAPIGFALLLLLLAAAGLSAASDQTEDSPDSSAGADDSERPVVIIDKLSDPSTHDCEVKAEAGSKVYIGYKGTLTNGHVFDSGVIDFTLGAGEVIEGWDKGIEGMCLHEKRMITIPPELGYGEEEVGDIPPNSHLVFTVEFLGLTEESLFDMMDKDKDQLVDKEEALAALKGMHPEATESDLLDLIEQGWKEQDLDKDGKLNYEEFARQNQPEDAEDAEDDYYDEMANMVDPEMDMQMRDEL